MLDQHGKREEISADYLDDNCIELPKGLKLTVKEVQAIIQTRELDQSCLGTNGHIDVRVNLAGSIVQFLELLQKHNAKIAKKLEAEEKAAAKKAAAEAKKTKKITTTDPQEEAPTEASKN